MKLETAVKHIIKEAEFLGFSYTEVLDDIRVAGPMVYSERSVEAYHTIAANSRSTFHELA